MRFWSPVVLQAVHVTGNIRLQRSLKHQIWAILVFCFWGLHLTAMSKAYLQMGSAGPAAHQYYFFSSCLLVALELGTLLYFMGLRNPVTWWRMRTKIHDEELAASNIESNPSDVLFEHSPSQTDLLTAQRRECSCMGSMAVQCFNWLLGRNSSAGVRYHRDLLL
eukprot:scaffold42777_cov41-Prasinocladus_malaysianus.AAC.1